MPVKRDMSHVHLKRGIVNLKLGRYINHNEHNYLREIISIANSYIYKSIIISFIVFFSFSSLIQRNYLFQLLCSYIKIIIIINYYH